jgi:hypothetical protein
MPVNVPKSKHLSTPTLEHYQAFLDETLTAAARENRNPSFAASRAVAIGLSSSHVRANIGIKLEWVGGQARGMLDWARSGTEENVAIRVTQVFYAAAFVPEGVSVMSDSVADPAKYGYVSCVTYGRSFMAIARQVTDAASLCAALDAKAGFLITAEGHVSSEQEALLSTAQVDMLMVGAGEATIKRTNATEALKTFLGDPGAGGFWGAYRPLSFTVRRADNRKMIDTQCVYDYSRVQRSNRPYRLVVHLGELRVGDELDPPLDGSDGGDFAADVWVDNDTKTMQQWNRSGREVKFATTPYKEGRHAIGTDLTLYTKNKSPTLSYRFMELDNNAEPIADDRFDVRASTVVDRVSRAGESTIGKTTRGDQSRTRDEVQRTGNWLDISWRLESTPQ